VSAASATVDIRRELVSLSSNSDDSSACLPSCHPAPCANGRCIASGSPLPRRLSPHTACSNSSLLTKRLGFCTRKRRTSKALGVRETGESARGYRALSGNPAQIGRNGTGNRRLGSTLFPYREFAHCESHSECLGSDRSGSPRKPTVRYTRTIPSFSCFFQSYLKDFPKASPREYAPARPESPQKRPSSKGGSDLWRHKR